MAYSISGASTARRLAPTRQHGQHRFFLQAPLRLQSAQYKVRSFSALAMGARAGFSFTSSARCPAGAPSRLRVGM
eukprot:3400769-Pyramimonas_sp.AAC.1